MKQLLIGALILGSISSFAADIKIDEDIDPSLGVIKGIKYKGQALKFNRKKGGYIFFPGGIASNVSEASGAICHLQYNQLEIETITRDGNKYGLITLEYNLKSGQEITFSNISRFGSIYPQKIHVKIESPKELSGYTLSCENEQIHGKPGRAFVLDDLESILRHTFTVLKD